MARLIALICFIGLMFCTAGTSLAQILPDTAQAHLSFPQFADGGPAAGQWQTTFTFSNPNGSVASVTLFLIGNEGQALQMDLGSGLGSQFTFSVPAHGTAILQSRVASSIIMTGWAEAISNLAIQGVVSYRLVQNGIPSSEVSVASTAPTVKYFSGANAFLGIAVANVYTSANLSLRITAHGNDGLAAAAIITIPPRSHRSFNLSEAIPTLNADFIGTVDLEGVDPANQFLAWTLKSNNRGVYSSLPSGTAALPISQTDRILRVFARVRNAALADIPQSDSIQLSIPPDPVLNALGNATGITIYLATAELIADSDSELAFAIAHELGHVYQFRTGILRFNANPEFDADTWGVNWSLLAGYDPYAGAGTLAKLAMASGQAGLITQFENQLSPDAHKSFNQRLDSIYDFISQICNFSSANAAACANYRRIFHPHMPGGLLLTVEPR